MATSSTGSFLMHFLKTRFVTTTGLALIGTGTYVTYKDYRRYPRMMDKYATGCILPPLDCNNHETQYFPREDVEKRLTEVLTPTFSNEYYLVKGDVGTGKSRTMIEVCRELKHSRGSQEQGAPVYVLASQGKSFPDTLAKAVGFLFDEHINFRFFLDFVLRINSMPSKEDSHKLARVLDAIEESAQLYAQKNGKPAVLVIDGAEWLAKHLPASLERIQEKAKLWSDSNIVKLILVTNNEQTDSLLQKNQSNWSRAESPIFVGDLSYDDAIAFLRSPLFENSMDQPMGIHMTLEQARRVYDYVGGRVQYLLIFKRDFLEGVPFDVTVVRMKQKEREKFLDVPNTQIMAKVLTSISKSKEKRLYASQVLDICSVEDLKILVSKNIVKLQRTTRGTRVMLESRLTETIVYEFAAGK